MFWLLRFSIKWIVRIKILALAFMAGMAVAYGLQMREQYRTWGNDYIDDEHGLPGDDLVAEPDLDETRSVDIDAPREAVWPWLVQLGYGRGGWYSYGQLDRAWSPSGGPTGTSAEAILDEFQNLAEGDVVPTHREGGFVVRLVDANAALVLYLDNTMVREQVEEMVADADEDAVEAVAEMDMPPFEVSWSFVLEDAPGGRTRLIERMRVRVEEITEGQRKAQPIMAMGVFTLMRSQMLGIKRRAEALGAED